MERDFTREPIIHGDVLLWPVVAIPRGAKRVEGDRHTLALGEATGHSHVMEHAARFEYGDESYVLIAAEDILRGAVVVHEEHGPVAPEQAGAYGVIQQVEGDIMGGFRRVLD